jgi:hypothetical protein
MYQIHKLAGRELLGRVRLNLAGIAVMLGSNAVWRLIRTSCTASVNREYRVMRLRRLVRLPPFRAVLMISAIFVLQRTVTVAEEPLKRGIVVIANRTDQAVEVQPADGQGSQARSIAAGGVVSLATEGTVSVRFGSKDDSHPFLLDPNAAYEFRRTQDGQSELRQIGFASAATSGESTVSAIGESSATGHLRELPILTIPVRIVVDEDEPLVQSKWEPRLRDRLEAASAILEEHCGVRFEVVEAGVWNSDNSLLDFNELLLELEKEVRVPPARLVIGFTSQRRIGADKGKMGGTRIPLHGHILIREWSKAMSDRERIEILVHELGHFLGATHSPEMTSVMRAQLVDGKSHMDRFEIRFDPVNAFIMNLVAEEMRQRPVSGLAELSPENRQRLDNIYAEISRALPDDPGVELSRKLMASMSVIEPTSPLGRGVRDVLLSLIEDVDGATDDDTSDERTSACVRRVAMAAAVLPEDVSRHAFLLSLGVVLDDTGMLGRHPQLQEALQAVQSDPRKWDLVKQRAGRFTMRSRHDLAQHFWVSAALTDLAGEQLALAAGVTKELQDSNGGSGFSFADLAADMGGVELASRVLSSRISLQHLSQEFRTEDFLIDPKGLAEGLSSADFLRKYGTVSGTVYRAEESRLRTRVLSQPGFREKTP